MSWLKSMMEAEPPEPVNPLATIVIGTIEPDMHDTSKEAVRRSLKRSGFRTIDAGKSVTPQLFVQKVQENNATILALSINIIPAKNTLSTLLKALEDAQLRSRVAIIIGGAAVTQQDADAIGAYYGRSKEEAPDVAKRALSALSYSRSAYCRTCGSNNPSSYKFCGKCGTQLTDDRTMIY
jgi:methanogenic corrinoid protein MtbC1